MKMLHVGLPSLTSVNFVSAETETAMSENATIVTLMHDFI